MKKSSEIILLAALLAAAFIVPNVHAGDQAAGGRWADHRQHFRAAAAEKLGLSDAQKASLRASREQGRTELQALKADSTLTREQKRAQAQEIKQRIHAQARATFTPEQQAQIQQFRANHPNLGQRRAGGRGPRDGG